MPFDSAPQIKMDPRVKQLWTDALRHGKYRQTKNHLHLKDGGFCCLGVLTDLAIQDGLKIHVSFEFQVVYYDAHYSLPPESVKDWSKIDKEIVKTLVDMNDSGQTFKQIADYIEWNL